MTHRPLGQGLNAFLIIVILASCNTKEENVSEEDSPQDVLQDIPAEDNPEVDDASVDSDSNPMIVNDSVPTEDTENINSDIQSADLQDEASVDASDVACNPSVSSCPCEWRPDVPTFSQGYYFCCSSSTPFACNMYDDRRPSTWGEVYDTRCGTEDYPYADSVGDCMTVWDSLDPPSERYVCNVERNGYSYCPCEAEQDYCCEGGFNGYGGAYHACEAYNHPLYGPGFYFFRKIGKFCDMEGHACSISTP